MPKVSVIIPVYNHYQYLAEAIQSVKAQTYSDYEIVVVNDGSTEHVEETEALCRKENVIYIWRENGGPGAARNTGICSSPGEYLVFLDADDVILPHKLELQSRYLDQHPEIGLVFSDSWVWLPEDNSLVPFAPKRVASFVAAGRYLDALLLDAIFPCHACMVRKECFEKVGLFDETLRARQDRDMWLRVTEEYGVGYAKGYVAKYRMHRGSITGDRRLMTESLFQQRRIILSSSYYSRCSRGARARFLRRWGTDTCLSGDMRQGRSLLARAVREDPSYLRSYAHVVLSLFGHRLYTRSIELWQVLRRWVVRLALLDGEPF